MVLVSTAGRGTTWLGTAKINHAVRFAETKELNTNIGLAATDAKQEQPEAPLGKLDTVPGPMPRILQANVNHYAQAQDLQEITEEGVDIAIVAEPHRVPSTVSWFADIDRKAAIVWNPGTLRTPCVLVCRGEGYVGAKVGDLLLISCYISPNRGLPEFKNFL